MRVPGIIEWPAQISEPRVSDVNSVTSDMLPTLCELAGEPLPDRLRLRDWQDSVLQSLTGADYGL